MSAVKPIPDGYHSVTPYLVVRDAAGAIEFYKKVFDASETMRISRPDGKIGHTELRIGDSVLMMADECPQSKIRAPEAFGGSPISLMIYVADVDAVFARAGGRRQGRTSGRIEVLR